MLFALDLCAIAFLAMRAYKDGRKPGSSSALLRDTNPGTADGLDRFEVPFFGGLASSFVDSE